MAHGAQAEESSENALQFGTGGLVDERECRCGHKIIARTLAAHFPLEPQGTKARLAATHAGQHQHDALVRFPRLLLASMEIEARAWFGIVSAHQSYQGRASPGGRGLHRVRDLTEGKPDVIIGSSGDAVRHRCRAIDGGRHDFDHEFGNLAAGGANRQRVLG